MSRQLSLFPVFKTYVTNIIFRTHTRAFKQTHLFTHMLILTYAGTHARTHALARQTFNCSTFTLGNCGSAGVLSVTRFGEKRGWHNKEPDEVVKAVSTLTRAS